MRNSEYGITANFFSASGLMGDVPNGEMGHLSTEKRPGRRDGATMDLCATLADQSVMLLVCGRQVLDERRQPRCVKCQSTDQTKEPECRKGVRECTLQSFHICHFFLQHACAFGLSTCLVRACSTVIFVTPSRLAQESIHLKKHRTQLKGNNVQGFVTRWDEVPRMTQGFEDDFLENSCKNSSTGTEAQHHVRLEKKPIMEHCICREQRRQEKRAVMDSNKLCRHVKKNMSDAHFNVRNDDRLL